MRVGACRLNAVLWFFAIAFGASSALALPSVASTSYSTDELQFTVKVPSIVIEADPRTYCSIDITMVGTADDTLTSGGTVSVKIYIDDGYWSDTAVFASTYSITSAEASANKFARTIDCTGDFQTDGLTSLKVYGFVDGDPSAWITNRRGGSNTVAVTVQDEDTNNNDNSASSAQALGSGVTSRIAKDADWYSLSVNGTANVTLTFEPNSGALDLALTDAGGTTLVSGTKFAAGMTISKTGLAAGTYKIKVSPRAANDPNFYDLAPTASSGGGGTGSGDACTGTGTQSKDCGNCGKQSRTCNGTTYGAWSACSGTGACAPGDSQTTDEGCASGKVKTLTCNESCAYDTGACVTGTTGGTGGTGGGTGTGDNGGMVGKSCAAAGDCGGTLECTGPVDDHDMFRNGYCSIEGCNADSACLDGNAICGGLFGDTFCLQRCSDSTDCRSSYVCARYGNARACTPRCSDDSDCGDASLPYCDSTSGLCLSSEDADPQAWNGTRPNADGTTSGGSAALADSGGCAELGGGSWASLFGALLMAARVAAKRAAAKARSISPQG